MPKHKNKMKMPKHKTKVPPKFDQSFSNKRRKGILPVSQNQLSSHTPPPTTWCLKQHQQQFCCNNNKLKLLVIHGDFNSPSVSILSTEEEEKYDTDHTFCDPNFGCPVASCHELVLLASGVGDELRDDEQLALYNPSTKDKRTLRPQTLRPPPSVNFEWSVKFYGFGLDPKSNDDFKVVRYLEFEYEDDNYHTAAGFMGNEVVELYSLKTNSWKRIPYPHPNHATPVGEDPIYINGFNYWIVPTGQLNEDLAIVSFDFAKESFPSAFIPGPPNEAYKFNNGPELYHFLLAEYEGSLALVVHDKHEKQIELWVWNFDNRTWSSAKVWAVGVDVFSPCAFLKNHLFYFQDSKGELVLFDCTTQKLKFNHGVCAVQPLSLIVYLFLTRTA